MSTAQSKQIGRVYSLGLETEIEPIRAFPTACSIRTAVPAESIIDEFDGISIVDPSAKTFLYP